MSPSLNKYSRMAPLAHFPERLRAALIRLEEEQNLTIYVSGGTIRDWPLERRPADLDLCVKHGARQCCRKLIDILGGGAFVSLGTEDEEAARVVWQGITVDFSSFRKGAQTITEELHYRDFTINAMAMTLSHALADAVPDLIDPLGGRDDLAAGVLRCCPAAFAADPLRMLRGYRFQAELGFIMDAACIAAITLQRSSLARCAAERVQSELERIMAHKGAGRICKEMAATGLFWEIFPELEKGVGLEQPGYHHKDVFHHSLLALQYVDTIIDMPQRYFGEYTGAVVRYLHDVEKCRRLRWSALFHDLGKPATASSGTMASGRRTFYNHDRVGRRIFMEIAMRLRMSRQDSQRIGALIEMHMHPFHLAGAGRERPLSRKALLKICKKAGDELPGLFVLAMADSLAGQGELKPAGMEEELAALFDEVQKAEVEYIKPVLHGERLLTGHDLIKKFHLTPGPYFREILDELEVARIEEKVTSRQEALSWLEKYLEKRKTGTLHPGEKSGLGLVKER